MATEFHVFGNYLIIAIGIDSYTKSKILCDANDIRQTKLLVFEEVETDK